MDDFCFETSPFNSPLSIEKAGRLIDLLGLQASACVLDVGCGRGEFLLRSMERYGVKGTGVDPNQAELSVARQQAAERVSADRLRLIEAKAEDVDWDGELYDSAFCIGSSHAFGAFADAAARLKSLVKPGGAVVLGDLYWRAEPGEDYKAFLGEGWPRFDLDFVSLAEQGESAGLMLMYATSASRDEWDHFEGVFAARRIRAAQGQADSQAAIEQAQAWHRAYLRWGRGLMGFGYFVYQVPCG